MSADVKGGGLREAVAKVIAPTPWAMVQRNDSAWRSTDTYFRAKQDWITALRKADTILAILPTADLLEALKGLLAETKSIGQHLPYNAPTQAVSAAMAVAEAAIAKAEGPSS